MSSTSKKLTNNTANVSVDIPGSDAGDVSSKTDSDYTDVARTVTKVVLQDIDELSDDPTDAGRITESVWVYVSASTPVDREKVHVFS